MSHEESNVVNIKIVFYNKIFLLPLLYHTIQYLIFNTINKKYVYHPCFLHLPDKIFYATGVPLDT